MKIAFVVDRFGGRFGGAEAYGVELMRELARHHDITVFAREYDNDSGLQLPFVPVRTRKGLPSWLRVFWFAVRASRLTRSGFDIVHSHMNGWCGDVEVVHVTPVRYNWRVRKMSIIKRLLSFVSPRVQTYLALEKKRVFARAGHRTVAVSTLIAEQLKSAYGGDLDAYPVIAPGVAPATRLSAEYRRELRADLGWTPDDYVCLLVARNPQRKGLFTVLQALVNLPDNVKLLVVGGNASTRDYVRRNAPSVVERVKTIDETSDVTPYYSCADAYVHPTLNDSFGMAPLEAMAYGLPVILSPSPWCGFAQYVTHNNDALVLSHPENVEELADYIRQLATSGELCRLLVDGSRTLVARHSWLEVARRYEDLYTELLQEREGRVASSR
ncbi:MAG: glycosyltransferase family 4 protein [Pusillimonas sp.]|nr:glycosyltransferase family 4 protein [Pusillimonas sp.]